MTSQHAKRIAATLAVVLSSVAAVAAQGTSATTVESPNGRLEVAFRLDADGSPRYAIRLDGKPVLRDSRLGLVRDAADFSRGLRLLSASRAGAVQDRYEILTAKRRVNVYRANRRVFRLRDAAGRVCGTRRSSLMDTPAGSRCSRAGARGAGTSPASTARTRGKN